MKSKQTKFFPLDMDIEDSKGKSLVRIWGRTDKGKRLCVIDKCKPFFWLLPQKNTNLEEYTEKVKQLRTQTLKRECFVTCTEIEKKNFLGKQINIVKVLVNNPKDIPYIKNLALELEDTEKALEADINYITRYILEKKIKPLEWCKVSGQPAEIEQAKEINCGVIKADKILPVDSPASAKEEFRPKVMAFDIEADTSDTFELGKGNILMISFACENLKKVLTWKKAKNKPDFVEYVNSESEMIIRFCEIVKEQDPDILTGYFSDGFDIPYLKERAEKKKIPFILSLDKSKVQKIRGAISSSKFTGRVHIDLFKFVSNILSPTLKTETLGLGGVAEELIGEGKLGFGKEHAGKKTDNFNEIEWQEFYKYSLQDSVITEKLFWKLWPNIIEITKIVGEPLWNTSRSRYSQLVENYVIHNLKRFNEIAPDRPTNEQIEHRRRRMKYIGAFVKQPVPDLYERMAVFDFRSFWPSIIVSFNISLPTLLKQKEKKCYQTPEFEFEKKKQKFFFKRKKGFIPTLLEELLQKRRDVKAKLKKSPSAILSARDYGLKTLANATYGYFGYFGARYYSPESGASITAISRHYIRKVIKEIESKDFRVIYSDTDSIMFSLGNKTKKSALNMLKELNKKLPGMMELELEDFYKRGLFVTKRTGEIGAKKKYALLNEKNKLKIRGFETVRRDWCALAKQVQNTILKQILEQGNPDSALKYTKQIIKKIKNKQIEKQKLIIRTQLKKAIDSYNALTPHVKIAKRMQKKGLPVKAGTLIEYIVKTGKKNSKVRDRARLPDETKEGEYDEIYYTNKQIVPAVEKIFEVFGINKQELESGQKNLSHFT